MEIWKPIPGFEGRYEASTEGRIRSVDHYVPNKDSMRVVKGKVITPWKTGSGYLSVSLGRKNKKQVHRLIAYTFLGNPPLEDSVVNHKNWNITDNRVSNLEWCSPIENYDYSNSNGRYDIARTLLAKPVRCVETGFVFGSSYLAAEWLNEEKKKFTGNVKNMSGNIRTSVRKNWSYLGYHWERVKE